MFCVPILQAVCLPSLIYYLSSIYLSSGVMCDYKFLSLLVYWVSPNHHLLSKFIINSGLVCNVAPPGGAFAPMWHHPAARATSCVRSQSSIDRLGRRYA